MLPLESITCQSACLQCITACQICVMMSPNDPSTERGVQLAADCADACRLLIDYIARESGNVQAAALFCAQMCDACAEACADLPNDPCQECSDVCWACADVCRWSSRVAA
jgi:hypothetical protein